MLKKISYHISYPSLAILLGFLLLLLLARLGLASFVPLFFDEAYYRLWSEQLEWGYYDHPPMIAWCIRLGSIIAGDTRLAVRLVPIALILTSSIGVYLLAREFGLDKTTSRRTVIWTQSLWLLAMAGMIAIPDTPASFFWIFTCLCVARAARLDSTRWWIAAGAMAGLACLAKYTSLFLAPGILLWLISSPRYRWQLLRPGPWLAIVAALAVFAPNIVWNFQNDWATVIKQIGRAVPEDFSLTRPAGFFLKQIAFVGPIIFLFAIKGFGQSISWRFGSNSPQDDKESEAACMYFVASTSLPLIIYMLTHGFHSWIGGHWMSLIYPAMAMLAALGANDRKEHNQANLLVPAGNIAMIIAAGPLLAFFVFDQFDPNAAWNKYILILFVLFMTLHLIGALLPAKYLMPSLAAIFGTAILIEAIFLLGRQQYPMPQAKSWPQSAKYMQTLATRYQAKWIGTGQCQTLASLYQHLRTSPKSAQINERFRYTSANPSWQIDPFATGIIIEQQGFLSKESLNDCFEQVKKLPNLYIADFLGYGNEHDIYLVSKAKKNWIKYGC